MFYLIQYLSDVFASASYLVADKFYKPAFHSTVELFAYSNFTIVIILLIAHPWLKVKYSINILNLKTYAINRIIVFATWISVISSLSKTAILGNVFDISSLQNITQLELKSYSLLSPFITLMLCHYLLNDQRLNVRFLKYFLLSILGLVIFHHDAIGFVSLNIFLLLYTLLNGYSDYKLKAISKVRGLEMMLFDNLMFMVMSIVVFTIAAFNEQATLKLGIGKLDLFKLFNPACFWGVICVAVLSFFAHNFKMLSFKTPHIAGMIIVGIGLKGLNSIVITYFDRRVMPSLYQASGLFIMSLGVGLFLYQNGKRVKI